MVIIPRSCLAYMSKLRSSTWPTVFPSLFKSFLGPYCYHLMLWFTNFFGSEKRTQDIARCVFISTYRMLNCSVFNTPAEVMMTAATCLPPYPVVVRHHIQQSDVRPFLILILFRLTRGPNVGAKCFKRVLKRYTFILCAMLYSKRDDLRTLFIRTTFRETISLDWTWWHWRNPFFSVNRVIFWAN